MSATMLSLSLPAPSPPAFLPPSLARPVESMPYFLCCLWNGTHSLLFAVFHSAWMNLRVSRHLTLIWEWWGFVPFSALLSLPPLSNSSSPFHCQWLTAPPISVSLRREEPAYGVQGGGGGGGGGLPALRVGAGAGWACGSRSGRGRGGGVTCMCVRCSLAWPCLPPLVWLQCVCSLSCQLCCEVCWLPCQPLLLLLLLPPLLLGLGVRGEGFPPRGSGRGVGGEGGGGDCLCRQPALSMDSVQLWD